MCKNWHQTLPKVSRLKYENYQIFWNGSTSPKQMKIWTEPLLNYILVGFVVVAITPMLKYITPKYKHIKFCVLDADVRCTKQYLCVTCSKQNNKIDCFCFQWVVNHFLYKATHISSLETDKSGMFLIHSLEENANGYNGRLAKNHDIT